jgi:hypothetical protein
MKTATILGLIIISAAIIFCVKTPPQPHPMNCYCVTLVVSSITGEILKTSSEFTFVYDAQDLVNWQSTGTIIKRDSVSHLIIIEMRQCVEPDIKGGKQ